MVIRTLEATYTVQSQLPCGDDNRVFVCEKEGVNDLFLLVEIADKEIIRSAVDFLMATKKMPEFSDFIDCFFLQKSAFTRYLFITTASLSRIF